MLTPRVDTQETRGKLLSPRTHGRQRGSTRVLRPYDTSWREFGGPIRGLRGTPEEKRVLVGNRTSLGGGEKLGVVGGLRNRSKRSQVPDVTCGVGPWTTPSGGQLPPPPLRVPGWGDGLPRRETKHRVPGRWVSPDLSVTGTGKDRTGGPLISCETSVSQGGRDPVPRPDLNPF